MLLKLFSFFVNVFVILSTLLSLSVFTVNTRKSRKFQVMSNLNKERDNCNPDWVKWDGKWFPDLTRSTRDTKMGVKESILNSNEHNYSKLVLCPVNSDFQQMCHREWYAGEP